MKWFCSFEWTFEGNELLRRDDRADWPLLRRPLSHSFNEIHPLLINSSLLIHASTQANMSGLVGYGSSDEEVDIQPERPAKVGDCYIIWTEKHGYLLMSRNAR